MIATLLGTIAVLATVRLVERPNLFTVSLFPIFLALVERARRTWHEPRAVGVLLAPVVLCAWTWMALHRGGLMSIPLAAAFAGYATFAWLFGRTWFARFLGPRPGGLVVGLAWLTAALVLSFTLLSPRGLATLVSGIGVVERTSLRSSISEWARMTPRELVRHFPAVALLTLSAAVVLVRRFVVRGTLVAWHLALLALFVGATLDSVRWVPYVAVVAAQLLVLELGVRVHAWEARPATHLVPLLVATCGLAVLVESHGGPFVIGEDVARTPRAAAELLRAVRLGDKVANALELGGFLVWYDAGHVRVLVDGRNETLYPPAFVARALEAEHDRATFDAMRADDHASVVVAVNTPGRITTPFLRDDPAWALVGWSDPATVWVRTDAHPALAAAQAYRLLDPRSLDGSVARALEMGGDRAQLVRELERMVTENPEALRPLVALAVYHHLTGNHAGRDTVLARLDILAPRHPAVEALRARFAGRPGPL